ncbi:hypothetical protein KIPB_002263 [Kipferlia bialata]|uniref:G protein-coupled receptor n=1 Tax=Kipferlia bialata TaxID=797122 RepID=A0A9K3CRI5_9EUKA|nr:hypothetical protein KIPB_002263 [Kipferlia bialata]|eukprot:g2263.t1
MVDCTGPKMQALDISLCLGLLFLMFLFGKGINDVRHKRRVATIDLFVATTILCDMVHVGAYRVSTLVTTSLECMTVFVLDYSGGVGGEIVMCCFAHFTYLAIASGTGRRKRVSRGTVTRAYLTATSVTLLALNVAIGSMGLVNTSTDCGNPAICNPDPLCETCYTPCWFNTSPAGDTPLYTFWYEIPTTLIACATSVLLGLGFRLLYVDRKHRSRVRSRSEASSGDVWRSVWLSMPIPLVRMVQVVSLAVYDATLDPSTYTCTDGWYVVGQVMRRPVIPTILAYAVPRVVLLGSDRHRQRTQNRCREALRQAV